MMCKEVYLETVFQIKTLSSKMEESKAKYQECSYGSQAWAQHYADYISYKLDRGSMIAKLVEDLKTPWER